MGIRRAAWLMIVASATLAAGCASLQAHDPLQVNVAGITPLQGEGMELRLLVKLRVQNPNDTPIDYHGLALQMEVQGKTFASGVSDETGTVPRFGEAVIAVPVTISTLGMIRQATSIMKGQGAKQLTYEMKGKLAGNAFGARRFSTQGEFDLSGVAPEAEER
jgi:LEA14-like dessication related protein